MKRNKSIIFLFILLMTAACQQNEKVLYQSEHFKVLNDRVEQGKFVAKAISDTVMTSNYEANNYFSSIIQFKFSINGKDNELPYNTNHEANIMPSGTQPEVINVEFGKQQKLLADQEKEQNLPQNTKVKFRLDFRPVLNAFKQKGYYEDVHGEKIYKDDFKGVYIAGSSYPLNWDFENLPRTPGVEMKDPDGDGIYEIELTFNAYDPDAHVKPKWSLHHDISKYPAFSSESPLLNAVYNMTLDELCQDIEADSTFRTGEKWGGVWTRDISYSIVLSLAMLEPKVAKISLMKKVKNGRIIQDTGTGGAWPVSSDRVVWGLAAWEIYQFTGDENWLKKSFEIIRNSVDCDQKTIVDQATGLRRGESSFLDWRKQTYPLWMEPIDIYSSLNLGTNAAHYQVLKTLGKMADQLGKPNPWNDLAAKLKVSINQHLWDEQKGYFAQYLYGREFHSLSPMAEALGESFTLLFDVANGDRKQKVLENTPLLEYGIPTIYPQIPNISPYHNNSSWPFVQAFWTLAAAKEKDLNMVAYSYSTQLREAALFLTNKENMVAENGDFAGTVLNSNRQLWSIAGQLGMNYRVLIGITPEVDGLHFAPTIPETFKGKYDLKNFKYRQATLNISVEGWGDGLASFILDGKELESHAIPTTLTGAHEIEMVMNKQGAGSKVLFASFITAPETPILKLEEDQLSWTKSDHAVSYKLFKNGQLLQTAENTTFDVESSTAPMEYQVMAIDSAGMESFLSNPVSTVPANDLEKLEAESFNYKRQKEYSGYTGSGYVEFNLANRNAFDFKVQVPESGKYQLKFRYANGSGPINTDNKCGIRSLYQDDQFVASLIFPQRGKDEWSNWGWSNTVNLSLEKGTQHFSIRFEDWNTNMNGEVNRFLLDQIELICLK